MDLSAINPLLLLAALMAATTPILLTGTSERARSNIRFKRKIPVT